MSGLTATGGTAALAALLDNRDRFGKLLDKDFAAATGLLVRKLMNAGTRPACSPAASTRRSTISRSPPLAPPSRISARSWLASRPSPKPPLRATRRMTHRRPMTTPRRTAISAASPSALEIDFSACS